MQLILLLISSVIIARFVEKKSRVISVAHAILFTVLLVFTIFTSDNPAILLALDNLFPDKELLSIFTEALKDSSSVFTLSFSVLFTLEMTVIASTCIAVAISIRKAIKAIRQAMRIYGTNVRSLTSGHLFPIDQAAAREVDTRLVAPTYLELCQLRN